MVDNHKSISVVCYQSSYVLHTYFKDSIKDTIHMSCLQCKVVKCKVGASS